jgi:vacuolar-type H+-ATPase catalytic subunit A/Vma1
MSNRPVPLVDINNNYSGFAATLTNLEKGDIIYRPNCKFCNHPARMDAEKRWERAGSWIAVEKFFENYRQQHPESPEMNNSNIRAHLINHYDQQFRRIRMRDYLDHLQEVMNQKLNHEQMLNSLATSLKMKYLDVASDGEMDTFRQVDAMTKIAKVIVEVLKHHAEIKGDIKPVNIFAEQVLHVWSDAIKTEHDDGVKRRLMDVMDVFQQRISGLPMGE